MNNKCTYFAYRFYEQGKKCGQLLAKQLKKKQGSRHVHNLLIQNKKIVETRAIATEFHRFYETLYNIQTSETSLLKDREGQRREEIQDYIRESSMPTLSETITAEMEHPITVEELSKVIAILPTGKSSGPDGLTS